MSLKTPSQTALRYRLKESSHGFVLYIWEPAHLSESRVRPFLFMAKHPTANREAAMEILNQYLQTHEQNALEYQWHEPSALLRA
jgi:hypothetical protein